MSYCRRLVRLDGQIVLEKSSFQTDICQTICSSKNLFVPFAHQQRVSDLLSYRAAQLWNDLPESLTNMESVFLRTPLKDVPLTDF